MCSTPCSFVLFPPPLMCLLSLISIEALPNAETIGMIFKLTFRFLPFLLPHLCSAFAVQQLLDRTSSWPEEPQKFLLEIPSIHCPLEDVVHK